jgi:hypothetical protein
MAMRYWSGAGVGSGRVVTWRSSGPWKVLVMLYDVDRPQGAYHVEESFLKETAFMRDN